MENTIEDAQEDWDNNASKIEEIKLKVIRPSPNEKLESDITFKIIIIGNIGVGKSCLSLKGVRGEFEINHYPTVGFDFFSFHTEKDDGQKISLQIWDTCGQEGYKSLVQNFYRNSSLAVIVYSITDRNSFDCVGRWVKELKTYSSPDVKLFLIGNKSDLEENRVVSTKLGEELKESLKFDLFMETSAKSGVNAEELFIKAVQILYQEYQKYKSILNDDEKEKRFSVKGEKDKNVENELIKNKKRCC